MTSILAPWPFLESGAVAVSVATLFDGATVEVQYLWRGGAREARDPSGAVVVRLGDGGFELTMACACEGDVAVDVTVSGRAVSLRELSLCGVTVVPIGPRTRASVRVGALTLVVTGTTAPRRLRLRTERSWRRRLGLAVTALAAAVCALALQTAAPRRRLDLALPELVRARVALLEAMGGGRTAATAKIALLPPRARVTAPEEKIDKAKARTQRPPRQATAPAQQVPTRRAAKDATVAQTTAVATAVNAAANATDDASARTSANASAAATSTSSAANKSSVDANASPPATANAAEANASTAATANAAEADASTAATANAADADAPPAATANAAAASSAAGRAPRMPAIDDARRAAAARARAAGIVGILAQTRASFLGDRYAAAAEVDDSGTIGNAFGGSRSGARGAARIPAAGGASGDASGSASGGASGSGSGIGAAGSPSGTAFGDLSGSALGDRSVNFNGVGDVSGALQGDQVGDAYGLGGLGLIGSGSGGGGGGGTISCGNIGTIGSGAGAGSGSGYGRGVGGLEGRRSTTPVVLPGRADVHGSCDGDMIRRVVRAHVNEVRFCYERALQSRPTLSGRVVARFTIEPDGVVSSSSVLASTVGAGVDQCVAAAVARWQFTRCAGSVTYPFVFVPMPTRDAP